MHVSGDALCALAECEGDEEACRAKLQDAEYVEEIKLVSEVSDIGTYVKQKPNRSAAATETNERSLDKEARSKIEMEAERAAARENAELGRRREEKEATPEAVAEQAEEPVAEVKKEATPEAVAEQAEEPVAEVKKEATPEAVAEQAEDPVAEVKKEATPEAVAEKAEDPVAEVKTREL